MATAKSSSAESKAYIACEVGQDGVATLILDCPGPVNTLSQQLNSEMEQLAQKLEADPAVRAILLTSGKKDGFIAGADIDMLQKVTTAAEGASMSRHGKELLARIEKSSKPWVAAIHGACLGGGCEVALACHYRVASEEKVTQIGLPEVQLGLLPGAGGTQRLPRLIGIQAALDIILAGKSVSGSKARKLGLVDEVVPRAILGQVSLARARELAAGTFKPDRNGRHALGSLRKPEEIARLALEETPVGRRVLFREAKKQLLSKTHGNYPAPEKALAAVRAGYEGSAADGYEAESQGFGELTVSPEAKALISIFFAQTALKKDTGVDDPKVKGRPVSRVSMLGGGLMGGGIAYVTVDRAGLAVRLKDKDDAGVGRGLAYVRGILDESVGKRRKTRPEADAVMARLTGTSSYEGMKETDLFIEAVFEDLKIKQQVLRDVEAFCKEGAIFASNTSSLPIGKIAEASKRPSQVVGMHYFSPVHKMPLLEVIRQPKTSDETVATAVAVGKKQGKTVIVVNDGVGFYTSRVLAPYIGEAGFILEEGAAVDDVDRALVQFGFPVGPLQLLDEVGIDIAGHVAGIMLDAYGARMTPPPGFERLAKQGRAGRKNKKGFYLYDGGRKKRVDETVYDGTPGGRKRQKVDAEAVAERLALQMANEAALCLQEHVLRSPRDGDVGAVFGLGFPPFRGGPFRWMDSLGVDQIVRRMEGWRDKLGARFAPAPILVDMAKSGKRFYAVP
ncbi:MAG TPA: fatty acid oxidation complex subunit alpha FadJ [Myxococcales bacterium]|nr:fatty acid oxidation complex subunit alpha FadJ [Myxococcales bacterium]